MNFLKKTIKIWFVIGLYVNTLFGQPLPRTNIEANIYDVLPIKNFYLSRSDKSNNYEYSNWIRRLENQDEYPTASIPPNFLNFNIEISKKDLEKYLKKKGHKFSAKWVSGNITIIHNPSAIFSKAFIGDSISGAKIVQYNYSEGQEMPSYVTVYIDHSKVNILDTLKFLVQKLGPPSSYAKSIKEKDLNFYIDWVNGDPNSHISSITLDSHDSFIGDFQVNPLTKFSYSITIYSNAHGCKEQD